MTTFLNTPIEERSINDIPELLNDIRSILNDIDQHELHLDPVTYRQLARHATLIQEGLEDIQSNWEGTAVDLGSVQRRWTKHEGTGKYRLDIDRDEIVRKL
jgi:hypothetical protein